MRTSPLSRQLRAVLVLSLLLSSCGLLQTKKPLPPLQTEYSFGRIYASNAFTAQRYATIVEELLPKLPAALPHSIERPLDLRIYPQLAEAEKFKDTGGLTYSDHIELSDSLPADTRRFILAHELVHYSCDETWKKLPLVLQEGLADWVAEQMEPQEGSHRRVQHALMITTLTQDGLRIRDHNGRMLTARAVLPDENHPEPHEVLRMNRSELDEMRAGELNMLMYSVGYLYVHSIGLERLRELCERAESAGLERVPEEWIEAESGLGLAPENWAEMAKQILGPEERRFLLNQATRADDDGEETP